jgi:hypothetical protein
VGRRASSLLFAVLGAVGAATGQQRAQTTVEIGKRAAPATVTLFTLDAVGDTLRLRGGFLISY